MSVKKIVAIVTSTIIVSITLATVLFVSFGNDKPSVPVTAPGKSQVAPKPNLDELTVLVNKERTDRGLPALERDPLLDQAAKDKCADMVTNNYVGHYSPANVRGISFIRMREQGSYYGENLSFRYRDTLSVKNGWMNSKDGHREAILDTRFDAVGYATCDVPNYFNTIVQFFIDKN